VRCSSGVRPISGSSAPFARAIGEVHRVGAERIARRRSAALAAARVGVRLRAVAVAAVRGRRHLADAVRDVLEDVEPRHALRREQLRRRTTWTAGASPRARRPTGLPAVPRSGRAAPPSAARGGTPSSGRVPSAGRAGTARCARRGTCRGSRRSCGRSAPQAARIARRPGSCASA
jgi:hypothetical protein